MTLFGHSTGSMALIGPMKCSLTLVVVVIQGLTPMVQGLTPMSLWCPRHPSIDPPHGLPAGRGG